MNAAIGLSLIILFSLGVPIAISIVLASIIGIEFFSPLPLLLVPQQMFVGIDSFPLMAIPFFILAGNLMNTSGISLRLINFVTALIGFIRGGLGMVNIGVSMVFAEISGSAVADVAATGTVLIPEMKRRGYSRTLAVSFRSSVAVSASASAMALSISACSGSIPCAAKRRARGRVNRVPMIIKTEAIGITDCTMSKVIQRKDSSESHFATARTALP